MLFTAQPSQKCLKYISILAFKKILDNTSYWRLYAHDLYLYVRLAIILLFDHCIYFIHFISLLKEHKIKFT